MPNPVNAGGRRGQSRSRPHVVEVAAAVVRVERVRLADEIGDEQILVAVESKSPDAMPMLPSGLPAALKATPDRTPSSTNVPSPRFIHSWFGVASLAT